MTVHLDLDTKKYLIHTFKRKDVSTFFISQLPANRVPQRGACLLQDYWHSAAQPFDITTLESEQ
jgi:hypothetical protein